MAEKLFVGGGELGALLRLHDWSQTPLGAVETWSDDLKTAVQILLTELDQTKSPGETQPDAQERQDNSAVLQAANQLNAFRVKLAEALPPLTDALEIQAIAARILGETLGASRVIYIEVVPAGEEVIVHCNYTCGVGQLSGRYRLEDYSRNLTADHQVEHTQVVTDIPNNPKYTDAEKTRYREIDIAAHIDVPLIKNNQFVALLAAQQSTPRQWTETEVKLVEETAEQTWAAVERAYAEAALRESEAKYRTLFESIDEGFCIVELLFDEYDTPVDYRFLEINSVFEQLTGLQQAVGKTARQLVPDLENFWIETYGRVALTGESVRFENRSVPINRWFDVYACRTGQPEDRKVAIVFKDISDRKRIEDDRKQAEAALRSSEEQLRLFVTASSGIVYKMSADWSELRHLNGKDFLASTENPSGTWVEQYIPSEDRPQLRAAILAAIHNKSTFELEHRVIQLDGTIGWAFSRAIPLLNAQQEIIEWLGAASDITQRKQAELNADFLATVTQNLIEANGVDEILQIVGEQLNRYLKTSRCAFVEINEQADEATIQQDWHQENVSSLVGVYRLPDFLTEEFFQLAKTGNPIVVRDISKDARVANQQPFATFKIGSFINVPLIENGEWKFTLGIYHQEPYHWRSDEIELMRDLANRIWTMLERARAEAALQKSEQRFRLMADAVPQIVWITDTEGRVEFFNKQWSNYTGASYEPTTAAEVAASFVHPEDGDRTIEAFNAARRSGGIFSVEHRIRSAAGTYRWFLVRAEPYRDPQTGEIIRWFGASIDIHDRKQAEAMITTDLENTQLLRDLSTQLLIEDNIQVLYDKIMAAAITLTRADAGTVQILDKATQELVLLASQGFEQTITDHFDRVNASSNTSCGLALLRGTRAFIDFDMPECDDPCGALRIHINAGYRSAQSTPLISRSGRPLGMVSTHWRKHHRPAERELRFLDLLARQAADLLEQRQTEAERQQVLEREQAAREEAERANRIKDEFLAVLSHELRSPLNPILGWTQLLQTGKLDEARKAEALKTIERNAKLQTQLIEDLLDISRIMQGKLSLTATPVSLTFVISAAIETVRLAAEAKHIRLQLDLDYTVAPISGDAARLQQVLWNLLSNAVKFTPAGGQVTVELRQLNQLAQIRVIDTGKGINPQFLPYMFEYFRQEDGSTTRRFGGLGLGLAIARQIVEMHGGTVRAESQGEGQGATFIVQLPAIKQTALIVSEPIQTKTDAGLPLEGIQILLVDDEPDTREFQAFLLEQNGAKVTAVASGLEALQALEQSIPDVLVSDIGMAQMDGYMLLQQIRSRPLQQGGMIPAIALTAYAAEIDRQLALQVGFQAHITKPVESDVLLKAISISLGRI
ncbi:GAF domain-containing protein [Microcoleus sp. FACHB-672]|uniref:GAF domain-containing protein n=1 Tax=Microcoleus sp. FACHB-672 TaxID=2692825 RepID=UPI0018F039B1|nr:GAF domain-containing protein [Microcoleus sp. FACHB-672]